MLSLRCTTKHTNIKQPVNQMPILLSNFLKPVNVELFQFCIKLFIIIILDKIVCNVITLKFNIIVCKPSVFIIISTVKPKTYIKLCFFFKVGIFVFVNLILVEFNEEEVKNTNIYNLHIRLYDWLGYLNISLS